MDAPYVSQSAQVMRALYGAGTPLMPMPRRPRRPPPAVVDAEVLSVTSAPAGQIPVEQPLPYETNPAGYQNTPSDNPPAGSSIPVSTWRQMSTEQRLAYINASTEDRRRIENAVSQGISRAFDVFTDVVRREQERAAREGSETRANEFRAMLLRMEGQRQANQVIVTPSFSTTDQSSSSQNVLTRTYGGVPVWGWGLIAVGVGAGGYMILRGKGKKRRRK